jgi:hypothetical protein
MTDGSSTGSASHAGPPPPLPLVEDALEEALVEEPLVEDALDVPLVEDALDVDAPPLPVASSSFSPPHPVPPRRTTQIRIAARAMSQFSDVRLHVSRPRSAGSNVTSEETSRCPSWLPAAPTFASRRAHLECEDEDDGEADREYENEDDRDHEDDRDGEGDRDREYEDEDEREDDRDREDDRTTATANTRTTARTTATAGVDAGRAGATEAPAALNPRLLYGRSLTSAQFAPHDLPQRHLRHHRSRRPHADVIPVEGKSYRLREAEEASSTRRGDSASDLAAEKKNVQRHAGTRLRSRTVFVPPPLG